VINGARNIAFAMFHNSKYRAVRKIQTSHATQLYNGELRVTGQHCHLPFPKVTHNPVYEQRTFRC